MASLVALTIKLARWEDFYARRLVDDLGLTESDNGIVRISMTHYNSAVKIDRLITTLEKNYRQKIPRQDIFFYFVTHIWGVKDAT